MHIDVFMGGSVGTIPFHVVKRYLIGVKVTSFRPVMAMRRSTFAGGEQQADGRFRSSTDATFGRPPAKKQCSCLELVRGLYCQETIGCQRGKEGEFHNDDLPCDELPG